MKRSILNLALSVSVLGALVAWPSDAVGQNPYVQPDGSWISIDGMVEAVGPDAFTLDYGAGWITVEMDDGDRDADAYQLLEGDKVTVTGRIDDDFFETATIEASSVYVENVGTYFTASAVDEEDVFVTLVPPVTPAEVILQGVVTAVGTKEFTVDSGLREVTVDVQEMTYDPLDDSGYQKIELGDWVTVSGHIEHEFAEGREIVAESVVTLRHH